MILFAAGCNWTVWKPWLLKVYVTWRICHNYSSCFLKVAYTSNKTTKHGKTLAPWIWIFRRFVVIDTLLTYRVLAARANPGPAFLSQDKRHYNIKHNVRYTSTHRLQNIYSEMFCISIVRLLFQISFVNWENRNFVLSVTRQKVRTLEG